MTKTGRPPKITWERCCVPNCEESVKGGAKGFCPSHYQQMRKGLIDETGTETGKRVRNHRKGTPCAEVGCTAISIGKGLCSKHYQRQRAVKLGKTPTQSRENCLLCGNRHVARGFCQAHYAQLQRGIIDKTGKSLRALKRIRRLDPGSICRQPECDAPVRSKGWCNKHYIQYREGILDEEGNQLRDFLPHGRRPLDWRKELAGYILVRAPKDHPYARNDGSIYEHRIVMEEHLGRYLESGEVVHHINGVRDDNVITNLQLRRSRKEHGHGHEQIEDVKQALLILERLVNKGMNEGAEIKGQLQRLYRRL